MIFEYLIPKLQETFPNRGLTVDDPKKQAVFPGIHPDFGNLEIYEDGDEIILVTGKFTHLHFANYDKQLSTDEASKKISEDLIEFLRDTFSDKIVFWGSHGTMGGHYRSESKLDKKIIALIWRRQKCMWSGPLK